MVDFFTSDHHFNHANILKYCDRPFSSVEQMNEVLISRWNEVVNHGDVVYYLGDFGMGNPESLRKIMIRLRGAKFLIRGNHDKHSSKSYLERVGFNGLFSPCWVHGFWLSHYPRGEDRKCKNDELARTCLTSWVLCGHIHQLWRIKDRNLNVGVDVNEFYPIPLSKILSDTMESDSNARRG